MKERIRKLRRMLDLTQQAFGERIGIKRNTVANYETGRNEPVDSVVALICREFNVNEDWLRTGAGEMFNPEPSDELDALASKFGLSHGEYIFLEKYLKLKREERDNVFDFFMDVCAAIEGSGVSSSADAAPGSDLDIDAEVEAYRKQLEAQKKAQESLSVSPGLSEIAATDDNN